MMQIFLSFDIWKMENRKSRIFIKTIIITNQNNAHLLCPILKIFQVLLIVFY